MRGSSSSRRATRSLDDKIGGLELGADDYLPKPFHLAELSARIRSVLRRHRHDGRQSLDAGNVRLWPDSRRVEVAGREVELLRKEYDILHYFMSRPNHTIDKAALAEGVWGDHIDQADNFDFVYAQMKNLRRKVGKGGCRHRDTGRLRLRLQARPAMKAGLSHRAPPAWVLSLLLAAWAVLFYFALTDRIDRETDDALEARAETAIKQFLSGRALPDSGSGNDGCLLRSIPDEYAAVRPQEVYTDERIYIPERDAREPARVLRMLFRDGGGGWHELTVMAPAIEKNELTRALLRWVVSLYLVLLLLLLVVTAWVLHRTMRPLYALLRWLDDYTVGKAQPAAGRRYGRGGVPPSERCRTALCRPGRVAVRAAEAVHRQRFARDADPAGGVPQPAGDARGRRPDAHRGSNWPR